MNAARARKHAVPHGANDASIGSRAVAAPTQPNDSAIKAKVASMPVVQPQDNDQAMCKGAD